MTMVNKYGPRVGGTPAGRLAKLAHEASQDGARPAAERPGSSLADAGLWTEGDKDWTEPPDPLANPLPSPSMESGEGGSGSQVREPTWLKSWTPLRAAMRRCPHK